MLANFLCTISMSNLQQRKKTSESDQTRSMAVNDKSKENNTHGGTEGGEGKEKIKDEERECEGE